MIAHRLIEAAEAARLSLEPEGDRLIVEADGEPPADLVQALREHKAEVIATLHWLRRPLLLRDGRRLYRFGADAIPSEAPNHAVVMVEEARCGSAVLVADGLQLIVVERAIPPLPVNVLRGLRIQAGAIIAALRHESRLRYAQQPRACSVTEAARGAGHSDVEPG